MEKIKIAKDMLIEELVEKYPDSIQFLTKKGIVCFVCGEPAWGTLSELCSKKGIVNIDIVIGELEKFLNEINVNKISK